MLNKISTCAAIILFFPIIGFAQETFTYQLGGANGSTWESSANWTGGSGSFSAWPGESPQAGTLDNADLAAAHGANFTIDISTPGLTLGDLTLGSTTGNFRTVIRGFAGGTLTANQIRSSSSRTTAHLINIDFVMPPSKLELPNAVTLAPTTFNGQFLNHQPVANSFRIVDNQSRRTLTINGNVVLSNTATPGSLVFRNGGQPGFSVINGVIDDGTALGGRVSYVRGLFQVTSANTYTGETIIGANDPDVETQVEIHDDLAFGFGRLTSGGGPEEATLRSIGGTRTLANEIRLARDLQFAGSNSFVLNGDMHQSNTRRLFNDILGADKTLTINGDIYAADDDTPRQWTFTGTGHTIVNGSIYNSLVSGTASASLTKSGKGTVEFNSPSFYSSQTNVDAGKLIVNNQSGSATGSGSVTVKSLASLGGNGVISGSVTINSGGKLLPGNSVGLLTIGGLDLTTGASLSIELAGSEGVAGIDFDQLSVTGNATLAGNLAVTLTNLISPTASDIYPIVQATTLSGSFANVENGERLTTTDGIGSFVVTYDEISNLVALADFQPTFTADFDRDGDVDGDDLLMWQLGFGVNGAADADGDGDSDGADFLAWQHQFGSTVTPVSAVTKVPEPSGILLIAFVTTLSAYPSARQLRR